jgi:hypothetical protein
MLGVRFGPAAATNSRFFSAKHLALFGVVSCPAADDHHGFIKNRRASANEGFMRIFIFKSEARPDLRAFGGDLAGSQLPSQFKPWRAVGAVVPSQQPPYNLPRDVIERAIKDQGFQLFRLSKAE